MVPQTKPVAKRSPIGLFQAPRMPPAASSAIGRVRRRNVRAGGERTPRKTPHERINDEAGREPGIDAQAAAADGQGMAVQDEAPFGDLMAQGANTA